jgi:hypothetical protein
MKQSAAGAGCAVSALWSGETYLEAGLGWSVAFKVKKMLAETGTAMRYCFLPKLRGTRDEKPSRHAGYHGKGRSLNVRVRMSFFGVSCYWLVRNQEKVIAP